MKKNCEFCNGSGQISFFQGVSRFLLTVEECPECGGTGLEPEPASSPREKAKGTLPREKWKQGKKKKQRDKKQSSN